MSRTAITVFVRFHTPYDIKATQRDPDVA